MEVPNRRLHCNISGVFRFLFVAARVKIPIVKPKKLVEKSVDATESSRRDVTSNSDSRAPLKLRQLMMGEESSSSSSLLKAGSAVKIEDGTGTSSKVGSYVIGSNSMRQTSVKQKEEQPMKEEAVTANVFSTGKITLTGAKSISSLNYALETLKPFLFKTSPVRVCTLLLLMFGRVILMGDSTYVKKHIFAFLPKWSIVVAAALPRT